MCDGRFLISFFFFPVVRRHGGVNLDLLNKPICELSARPRKEPETMVGVGENCKGNKL